MCGFSTQRQALPSHLVECPFAITKCSFPACDRPCKRSDLESHQSICIFQLQSCPNTGCEYLTTANTMHSHVSECRFGEVSICFGEISSCSVYFI